MTLTINTIPDDKPVLIAGPTASGKSALALEIADLAGGVIVNADASQVYECWRVLTARPSIEEEARAPHALYGHVSFDADYSAGHWLRDALKVIKGGERPIIVGGTGLYFAALTQGLVDIPAIAPSVRAQADDLRTNGGLDTMKDALDLKTRDRIDLQNPMRVQRAYEVQMQTGRGLADWQDSTPAPALPRTDFTGLVFDAPKDWLNARIEQRFAAMAHGGALDEVRDMAGRFNSELPSCKAIGAPELMRYHQGEIELDQACESASIATRQYAKRQRTWFRSKMKDWHVWAPDKGQLSEPKIPSI